METFVSAGYEDIVGQHQYVNMKTKLVNTKLIRIKLRIGMLAIFVIWQDMTLSSIVLF